MTTSDGLVGRRSSAHAANAWVTLPAPRPDARLRLFCFPHAGSGVAQFRPWVELLPADVELCPIRLPGRENRLRETPFTRIEPLVEALIDSLDGFMDRPFALFGHSLGAVVAYAFAQHLQHSGRQAPAHLFVSGRRAPHLPDSEPPIHALPEAEFMAELRRRYGDASVALLHEPDLRAVLMPLLRADLELADSYAPLVWEPLGCPVTALGGIDDTRATEPQLAAWAQHTRGVFELKRFPGGHFFVHTARAELLSELALRLI